MKVETLSKENKPELYLKKYKSVAVPFSEISYAEFDGLYIDKKLFEKEEFINKIEQNLKDILKQEPIIHEDGDILFFDLTNFETDKEYKPIIKEYK